MRIDYSNVETGSGEETRVVKKTYQKPRLKIYGQVRHLTQGTHTVGNDDGINTNKNEQSERRVKENIQLVGQHPLGFNLYLFDYKPEFKNRCGQGRYLGVMVDEVEQVVPGAVSVQSDGYKTVNYHMLGISQSIQ